MFGADILWMHKIIFDEIPLQGILALFVFHYCNFSKLSKHIWLMRFMANFISLVQFFGYNSPKNALAKYLANVKFG